MSFSSKRPDKLPVHAFVALIFSEHLVKQNMDGLDVRFGSVTPLAQDQVQETVGFLLPFLSCTLLPEHYW